jgi:hypothetical protein
MVGVFIREKVWLENSLSQTFSHINMLTFLKPSHSSHLHACEDGTECSKMLAHKIQMPENYPEESIQQFTSGLMLLKIQVLRDVMP